MVLSGNGQPRVLRDNQQIFLHASQKVSAKCGGARYGKEGAGSFCLEGGTERDCWVCSEEMRRPRVECGLNFDSSGGGAGRHEELQEGGEENTNFLLMYAFTLFHLEGTCTQRYLYFEVLKSVPESPF